MKRKEFLQLSVLGSTALLVPAFLKSAAAGGLTGADAAAGRKLIVIQLSGGNDGLNTVIPYRNDLYYKLRPTIALKKENMLVLNDDLAMNCAVAGLKSLYDKGLLAIVNNVGYPNPDLSHFRSMDIWHSAVDSDKYASTGWIGRYLDHQCNGCAKPYSALEMDDTLSLALKGYEHKGMALHNAGLFYNLVKDLPKAEMPSGPNSNLHYLYKTMIETEESAEYLHSKSRIYNSPVSYPEDGFAKNLKTIAELIVAGAGTSVYYASLSGFDTHVGQPGQQERNLGRASAAIEALVADLQHAGAMDQVLIMVFSEFGRRVKQNASNGTDHGKASNVFLISSKLQKKGIYNELPDLEHLDSGDLAHSVDFRSIYATVLNKWLGADDGSILGRSFEKLTFI